MNKRTLSFLLIALHVGICWAGEVHEKALQQVAEKIETLGKVYPQLSEFTAKTHLNKEELKITYGFHTHKAERTGGWTSGVPNPDPDGIWFYIDLHDPSSEAQIHTQPITMLSSHYLGEKKLQFLILEGDKTKLVRGEIWKILKSVGVEEKKQDNEQSGDDKPKAGPSDQSE